ncbi:DUF6285 domain-containing protein [Pseudomonas sp. GD03858]|uniref:DUF6285 domain-containing protein n=1 Tax=unclassified Pseudomonas TaxID=196821 RepID=UPI0024471A9C|nr:MULTISPECIES: DUF6285 domain-containing protein [unclassified Pseudomonas]MDH0645323.1 DUF6285 domain-containing protein [Pseudomonas sp. GD03867]MDH0660945.1 DUF6285 domain-containing protein [Pseudomonas sp. GD03858]
MNTNTLATIDLLSTARSVLIDEVLPELKGARLYECRMIARAMAIVERELEQGPALASIEANALAQIMARHGLAEITPAHARSLLASFIRKGVFDEADNAQLQMLDALQRITQARLAISNPKVLRDGH